MRHERFNSNVVAPLAGFGLALLLAGCKTAPSDAALTQSVNSQLTADSSINGQPVQASVAGGVVTLNGTVQNDAQKVIAARDAAGVTGVKEVQNNIAVGIAAAPVTAALSAPPPPLPPQAPAPTPKVKQTLPPPPPKVARQAAPIERPSPPPPPQRQAQAFVPPPPPPPQREVQKLPEAPPPPPPQREVQKLPEAPPPPPPPPQPVYKNLTIESGSTLPVRITQTLDSATTQQGTAFSGVIASDILVDGLVAIPAGTPVSGSVDDVQEAAHYKGSSLLSVSLLSVNRKGERIAITTDPYTVKGKGRGGNTAEKVGGGAAVGAVLGGIFGGGKGAAIGAAAGGGVGAGANTVTRGEQVQIMSETVVRFHLANAMQVRVRTDAAEKNGEGGLQQHPTP